MKSIQDITEHEVESRRILAIASGGGHWVQLQRMAAAFDGHDVAYVTTMASYRDQVEGSRFYVICDGSRWKKFKLLLMAMQLLGIVLWERPDVVISTGAAPGYFGVRLGKLFGSRTVWIDSMANAERLSLSGEQVGPHADLWLTQWPHLAQPNGPAYEGGVL